MSAFKDLIEQIDGFIRRYYKNQILRGLLLLIGTFLVTYLLVVSLEYFGRFSSGVRAGMLISFIAVNGFILVKFVLIPVLKLKSFGQRISRYQAADIIGSFFPSISDRLLNTLQLHDRMDENSADYELLNASVQQRSEGLSVLPFSSAIDYSENKKYLRWIVPLVGLIVLLAVFLPGIFKQGTERVINFSKEFELLAPFDFLFDGNEKRIEEGENYAFRLKLKGDEIPEKVYVKTDKGRWLLRKVDKTTFEGQIDQVRNDFDLQFEAGEFKSDQYNVEVIGKSVIGKFTALVDYPDYLGMEDEEIPNAGDLVLPEGTKTRWSISVKNTSATTFVLGDSLLRFIDSGFNVDYTVTNDIEGGVVLTNKTNGTKDSSSFVIDVIKDNYPAIEVSEVKDSVNDGMRFFTGKISDDHGLTSLWFEYEVTSKDGNKRNEQLNVTPTSGTEMEFNFGVDFRKENIELEDEITYRFIVTDNDGVNGRKSTRSSTFLYKLPTLEELNEERSEDQEKTKDELNKLVEKSIEFKKNVERLKSEARDNKSSNWKKENQVEQLQEEQKSLLEDLKSIQEEMNKSVEEKSQLSEIDEELLKQQELINDLLDELMDDELKDLLEELKELMKQNNEQEVNDKLEELDTSSEEMKKQLDRSLEMLKRLQVNEKIDDIENELKELAEEQRGLEKEIDEKGDSDESDVKKQNDINDKFDQLKDDLKELDSLNNSLKSPMELGDQKEESEDIKEDLNDSKESLEKGKEKKASESQKSAAEKMEQMAEDMDASQQESNRQQQEEDIDMLRNILESLMSLSFDQEDVLNQLRRVNDTDPAFRKYTRKQRRIVSDTKIVADSLEALAERQPKIAKFVDEELTKIRSNHELSLEDIDERRRSDLSIHQQYTMTSYNNLALLLNESLQQMQQKMQNMMEGSGSCNNPGGKGKGKPSSKPGKMSSEDMKQALKKQLDAMKKAQKGGNSPGNKPGEKPGSSPGGNKGQGEGLGLGNEQVAKMAAQQAAMRRRLQEMKSQLNKDGKGTGNKLNPLLKELEQQQKDLVNKRLGNNLIKRQQNIMTRLLESEKALLERGLDDKRESLEGKNVDYGNQIRFDEYNKEKLRQVELLKSVDPSYQRYYKDRANEYFNRMR